MLGLRGEDGVADTVGRYRLVLPLGQGGTADVYLASVDGPSGFTKLVVVKVLRKNLASDTEFRLMFLSEARLAARLHHQNVVQTNEVIDIDGAPVLVMEYLDGQPLSQVIVRGKQGGFTLAMQLRVLADALAGLHAAHELADFDGTPLGVVHRDVSPHNLFLTVEGHAKVLDFGIAKLERSLVETEVGMVKGKLRYMAPEQIAGEKLDRRADIYAAGVILWETLTGERMWKASSEGEVRARVLAGDLPMPETIRPDVPAPLARICRRALSRAPGTAAAGAGRGGRRDRAGADRVRGLEGPIAVDAGQGDRSGGGDAAGRGRPGAGGETADQSDRDVAGRDGASGRDAGRRCRPEDRSLEPEPEPESGRGQAARRGRASFAEPDAHRRSSGRGGQRRGARARARARLRASVLRRLRRHQAVQA
jgi:tRNA A-37 threonylcarbamoyl transferase component Bud32